MLLDINKNFIRSRFGASKIHISASVIVDSESFVVPLPSSEAAPSLNSIKLPSLHLYYQNPSLRPREQYKVAMFPSMALSSSQTQNHIKNYYHCKPESFNILVRIYISTPSSHSITVYQFTNYTWSTIHVDPFINAALPRTAYQESPYQTILIKTSLIKAILIKAILIKAVLINTLLIKTSLIDTTLIETALSRQPSSRQLSARRPQPQPYQDCSSYSSAQNKLHNPTQVSKKAVHSRSRKFLDN